jgi:hypothetical protein
MVGSRPNPIVGLMTHNWSLTKTHLGHFIIIIIIIIIFNLKFRANIEFYKNVRG